jgi:ABC-2 type transport system permease protein
MRTQREGVARFEGLADVHLVMRQTGYEQLSFWLNPLAALFTVVFSVVFLVMLGATAGNSRAGSLGNIKLIQYYVPAFVAYGVMAACFMNLATTFVNRRETGLLKRLRLSPVPAWVLLAAIFLSTFVVVVVQVLLLLAVGKWGFGVRLPAGAGALVLTLLVGVVSFTALGVALSTFLPNADAAGPVVSVVYFILLFLSGLWFPIKAGSGLAEVSTWFPVRHFILAVYQSFRPGDGSPWAWHDLLVVIIWGAVGCVVAVRRFQWAPRRS